jgi:hypothetical protein
MVFQRRKKTIACQTFALLAAFLSDFLDVLCFIHNAGDSFIVTFYFRLWQYRTALSSVKNAPH